jgi:hypothetical protein
MLLFDSGEYEKICEVFIVNDTRYEQEELFRLVLGSPHSDMLGVARLGLRNATQVIIKDDGDSEYDDDDLCLSHSHSMIMI